VALELVKTISLLAVRGTQTEKIALRRRLRTAQQ
jgi:hypothetical protein